MLTKSNNTGGRGGARPGAGRKKSAVKKENLITAEEKLSQMYSMVIRSGVEAESSQLLEEPILTDTFKESFQMIYGEDLALR